MVFENKWCGAPFGTVQFCFTKILFAFIVIVLNGVKKSARSANFYFIKKHCPIPIRLLRLHIHDFVRYLFQYLYFLKCHNECARLIQSSQHDFKPLRNTKELKEISSQEDGTLVRFYPRDSLSNLPFKVFTQKGRG